VTIGLGEMEIMSNHVEALAGASGQAAVEAAECHGNARAAGGPRRGRKGADGFRKSATEATFKPVRQKIQDLGIELRLLCYNMNVRSTPDDEIEYASVMAKGLGVQVMSTSTQVSMAKRLAPFAEKHKIMVGFHGHSSINTPDEVATPESFEAVMAESKYHGANLDIGHYTAAGYDPVSFITQHHARITNLHLKDRKNLANGGANLPWGQGDTPIKDVLKLLQKNKWDLPSNIEFEYPGDPMVEMPKCLQFCKDALA
jgi:sugar phosphate isomerase/epimerase